MPSLRRCGAAGEGPQASAHGRAAAQPRAPRHPATWDWGGGGGLGVTLRDLNWDMSRNSRSGGNATSALQENTPPLDGCLHGGECSWSLGFPRSLEEVRFIWGVGLIMAAPDHPRDGL